MSLECPILTATRTGKKISSNPCNDCAMFNDDCQDDLARDLEEGVLQLVGGYFRAVRESARKYRQRLENGKYNYEPKVK